MAALAAVVKVKVMVTVVVVMRSEAVTMRLVAA